MNNNMGYCRVQNTYLALHEVIEKLKEAQAFEYYEETLSPNEQHYFELLKKEVSEFIELTTF